jgi:glutathione peroxidase
MKNIFILIAFTFSLNASSQSLPNFHDYGWKTIYQDTINFYQYYGKKVMIVNTASFCGYTYQFGELEQLYTQYQDSNFVILGFPCNNFGNQDPHDDSTINVFCTSNFNVTFQMMKKVSIITGDTAPIYKWLQRADLNGVSNVNVSWNFHKFLIDEAGNWVAHYPSTTSPLDTAITNWISSSSVVSFSENVTQNHNNNQVYSNQNTTGIEILNKSDKEIIRADIYNSNGMKIKSISYSNNISTTDLRNGFYILSVQYKDGIANKRFIISR